jgi:hypothetical protein
MKLAKMSLAAAILLGSSAFAIENVKVKGDARLYYETVSSQTKSTIAFTPNVDADMFSRDNDNAQAALHVGITADLASWLSSGVELTVTDTLGLENNLVNGTWAGPAAGIGGTLVGPDNKRGYGSSAALQGATTTQWWVSEAWLAATVGKTTAKVGRQYIDTPLAFTETWNIAANSFGAAVLLNQDIPKTTLVAAYVGQSNGASAGTVANAGNGATPFKGYTTYNNSLNVIDNVFGTTHNGVGGRGAYAAGVVTTAIPMVTFQAWYYDVKRVATAYWLQADAKIMDMIVLGAQYADMAPASNIKSAYNGLSVGLSTKDSIAMSGKIGVEVKDIVNVTAAYSQTDKKGTLNVQNTATGTQSKLYTEAWWNYGIVGMPGATSWMLNVNSDVNGMFGVFAQYTNIEVKAGNLSGVNYGKDKVQEVAVGLDKSFGALDLAVAYINTNMDFGNSATNVSWADLAVGNGTQSDYTDNRLQVYVTVNF